MAESDDAVTRAEELLFERLRTQQGRSTNGAPEPAGPDEAAEQRSPADAEALTRDLQRMAADFANYRKRTEADRLDFAKYAKADFIRRLLDVLDGYDRALETVPADVRDQPWVEGIWLVERKLRQLLESEGLQPLEAAGRPFDPYQHEAVAHSESDLPEGTVLAEYQKGYRLHERVIRPAMVTVSKGPATDGSARPADPGSGTARDAVNERE